MKYQINWSCSDGVFAVPDLAADCLKLASGKSLKFLLYILKNKVTDVPLAEIGKSVGISEEDAEDALSYWQQVGIINSDNNALSASAAKNAQAVRSAEKKSSVSAPVEKERSAKMITPEEISERVTGSEEVRFLFSAAETTFGKVLTYTEQRTLIWLYDYYGVTPDLIIMIMDFAVSQNKANIGFIEKIASQWHNDGINTHELAEREILRMQNYYSLAGQVSSKLELNRTLTPTERRFISEWAEKNIGIDLIVYAYEKMIDNIGKVKFSYMNTILLDWYSSGCFTVADVKKTEKKNTPSDNSSSAAGKRSGKNDGNHSYDLEELIEYSRKSIPKMKY